MSVATSTALILGGVAAAGSIGGALISSGASKSAAKTQQNSDQAAIAQQQAAINQTQANEAPYLSAGSTSIGQIMSGLNSGTLGPGSNPSFTPPAPFTPPTLAQAEQAPGYQFAEQQGELGLSRQQAASGGAFTGGTLKAASEFNTNLAQTTYQQQFGNALQGYQTNFQSALQAYQENLAKQQQEFQQLYAPAQIGANAASGTSAAVSNLMGNQANLLVQQGNAGAAGTVGSANAITSGINGATSGLLQTFLLNSLLPGSGGNTNPPAGWSGTGLNAIPPAASYTPPPATPAFAPQGYIPG